MKNKQEFLVNSYNVTSEIEREFGHWLVTSDGDVINYKYPYPIYSYHLNDDEWLAQLRQKSWFIQDEESNFLDAFNYACSKLNIEVILKEHY